MAKVRTLSPKFMAGHPKHGKPTYFVEQFLNCLKVDYIGQPYLEKLLQLNKKNIDAGKLTFEDIESFHTRLIILPKEGRMGVKRHTIRGGHHFKAGDKISIRCWFGKPYDSPQIILWDDLDVVNVWNVKITHSGRNYEFVDILIGSQSTGIYLSESGIKKLAKNDGLNVDDFCDWFAKDFAGQIIAWDKKVKY